MNPVIEQGRFENHSKKRLVKIRIKKYIQRTEAKRTESMGDGQRCVKDMAEVLMGLWAPPDMEDMDERPCEGAEEVYPWKGFPEPA